MNYDKWKKIEVSDDEDDTHPNIDTPSLFRWRHTARVERREQREEDQKEHEKKRLEYVSTIFTSPFTRHLILDFRNDERSSTKESKRQKQYEAHIYFILSLKSSAHLGWG